MTSGLTPASNFIVNIVELQNTITSASGLSPLLSLSNTVSQLQEMIIYDEKRIAANTISAYNTTPIQFTDSVNFAGGVTIGGSNGSGNVGSGSTIFSAVSTIGNGPSLTNYFSTTTATATAISFQAGSPTKVPVLITAGGDLKLPLAGTPGVGKYLTCMDVAGTAQWQTPAIPSDVRLKRDIELIGGPGYIVDNLSGVRFNWRRGTGTGGTEGTGGLEVGPKDVGVIAQEVEKVLPEAIEGGGEYLHVHYNKIIPVLIEEIKSLRKRVQALEAGAAAAAAAHRGLRESPIENRDGV